MEHLREVEKPVLLVVKFSDGARTFSEIDVVTVKGHTNRPARRAVDLFPSTDEATPWDPKRVDIVPVCEIFRMSEFPISETYKYPSESTTIPLASFNVVPSVMVVTSPPGVIFLT